MLLVSTNTFILYYAKSFFKKQAFCILYLLHIVFHVMCNVMTVTTSHFVLTTRGNTFFTADIHMFQAFYLSVTSIAFLNLWEYVCLISKFKKKKKFQYQC